MPSFSENQGARVFHLMMIVPAGLLLLLLSLISFSTLAVTNNNFVNEYDDKVDNRQERDEDTNCILYAETDDRDDVGRRIKFQEGNSCSFSIAGGGILVALSVAFIVVLVVKAFFGVGVFSLTALIELGMSAAGALWALIVASVITTGLNTTCQAYRDTFSEVENFPCCFFFYQFNIDSIDDEGTVFFYENINTSRITAWIAMVLLIVLAIVYAFIVIRSFFGTRGGKSTKTTSSAEKAAPV